MSVSSSTSPASTPLSRFALLARDIKISHSIFALPFALLATFLALAHAQKPLQVLTLVLIVVCMVLARTFAMAFNRWADARLDARNQRTMGRAIPSGRLSASYMLGAAIACGFGFIAACALFWTADGNTWPLALAPVLLAWLAGYSYTKRFTWLCHLYLGVALALSPIAASVVIAPAFLSQPEPWLLAGMVMCWVAGFDIIYAMQDVEADRATGTFSMPARLGVEPALWISRVLHVASIALLVALAMVSPVLHTRFHIGIGLVAALLILEHVLVWKSQTRHIDMAFFTLNGIISVVLGAMGIWDVLAQ